MLTQREGNDDIHEWCLDSPPQAYVDEALEAMMNPEPNWPAGYRHDRDFNRPFMSARTYRRSYSSRAKLTDADRELLTFAAEVIVDRVRRRLRSAALQSGGR